MTKGIKKADLLARTDEFLNRHWKRALGPKPEWAIVDPTVAQPDLHRGGCYAVMNDLNCITYVGLGLARRPARRPTAPGGVLRRLLRHVIQRGAFTAGRLDIKRDAWRENKGIKAIFFLPFPDEMDYLAAALEIFLIQRLGAALPMNKSRILAVLEAVA